mmetsp:Transcript_2778/g.6194  ORF Transcript_2778/g.6194 Transcript_2778/m.6194 type:complete len:109 (-) Transcript_2778:1119-1445(-)
MIPWLEQHTNKNMRQRECVTIQEALKQMRQASPYRHKIEEAMLVCAWKAIMPRIVCTRVERIFFKQEKLFVQVGSAPLRQELRLNKDRVLTLLQAHAQECTLTDIVFL